MALTKALFVIVCELIKLDLQRISKVYMFRLRKFNAKNIVTWGFPQ